MTQMANDLGRNGGGNPQAIVNALTECRCEACIGLGTVTLPATGAASRLGVVAAIR